MPSEDRPRSLRRLVLHFFLTLATLAGLLTDLLLLGPWAQPAAGSSRVRRTLPNTDVNPLGVNLFLDREVEDWKKQRTMEMVADAGIGWIHQQFSWAEIEPRPGYFWDDRVGRSSWDKFDRIVELAEAYGVEIIARIDRPPAWARPEGSNPQAPPIDPHTYADFVYQFVQHYRGRIHYIQIWNEPNLHTEWRQDAPVDPSAYATLLRLAYERAKEADPNIQVLCAPLAIHLTDDANRLYLSDLTFLEEMYRAGAAPYFDIMSANAYGFDDPPEAEPALERRNFRRVELLRAIMEQHGDEDTAVWFNEYGWNASPAELTALPWGRVSEQMQAEWTVRGIEYARENWPWAGVISIWYFRQVGDFVPTDSVYYFRMVNVDFTPMPVYTAVQQAAEAGTVAAPGWYEERSTPLRSSGEWQPIWDATASAGSYLASDTPGSWIVVDFQGSDLTLRVYRGPEGGRLSVEVDGVAGRGTSLPRDSRGRAYLDLYSPQGEWVELTLVEGLGSALPPRTHRLELDLLGEGAGGTSCAVDALEVRYRRSYLLFAVITAVLALATAAAAIALWREVRRPPAPRRPAEPVNPWTMRPEMVASSDEDTSAPPTELP